MKRENLEHLIRATGGIMGESSVVVVGSQSILGAFPNAPEPLLGSREADIFAKNAPGKSDILDGTIGENSPFDELFGYYAQGVDEATSTLPKGWEGRLVPVKTENTGGVTGYCLDPLDLACAKLVAYRDKDLNFVKCMLDNFLITSEALCQRLILLPDSVPQTVRQHITGWVQRWERESDQRNAPIQP